MSNKSRNTERLRDLLTRFDARPLSTRSLLLSFLLGTHPPELSVERLVDVGERFGVRAGTVRTTLSRMVASGDLTTHDARYRLSPRLVDRQRQQDEGLAPEVDGWDGSWWTVIAAGSDRSMAERRHFRSTMVGARMGELRPDIWMRPANGASAPTGTDLVVTRGELLGRDGTELAGTLWPIDDIESDAAALVDGLAVLDRLLDESAEHLPLAFDVAAVCVRHLRREPRLPAALIDMPACRGLRADYARFNERFRRDLAPWLRADHVPA